MKEQDNLNESPNNWLIMHNNFKKQMEKLAYAGVAIVWVFTVPVFSNDFSNDFQKFAVQDQHIAYSLLLFILAIILYYLYDLILMFLGFFCCTQIGNKKDCTFKVVSFLLTLISFALITYGYYFIGSFFIANILP